jgi:hypothetical protein
MRRKNMTGSHVIAKFCRADPKEPVRVMLYLIGGVRGA